MASPIIQFYSVLAFLTAGQAAPFDQPNPYVEQSDGTFVPLASLFTDVQTFDTITAAAPVGGRRLADMTTAQFLATPTGTFVFVKSVQAYFYRQTTPTAVSSDSITVFKPLGGASREVWVRLQTPNYFWQQKLRGQTPVVNAATGSDENFGDVSAPLATYDELIRRIGYISTPGVNAGSGSNFTRPFYARGVTTANVADLANFNVNTNTDGITYVNNDVVFLAAQTTKAQNGPYTVGAVSGGVAALTRPAWWPNGIMQTGAAVQIGPEGTVFRNTVWEAMLAANTFQVDTDDPEVYPQKLTGSAALVAGTFTINAPIRSVKSGVTLTRRIANTTAATVMYAATNGGANGITAGAIGTGAVVVQAVVAAGTINNADISTLNYVIDNQVV